MGEFNRSRVDRANRSSLLTINTSSLASVAMTLASAFCAKFVGFAHRPAGERRFYASGPLCVLGGAAACRTGRPRRQNEVKSRSHASLSLCRPSFHLPCSHALSDGHSYPRRRGWRPTHIGAHTRFVPIDWRALWQPAAGHRWLDAAAWGRPSQQMRPRRIDLTDAINRALRQLNGQHAA
jgi:hypothetical protein